MMETLKNQIKRSPLTRLPMQEVILYYSELQEKPGAKTLYALLEKISLRVTEESNIHFSTLYARLSYIQQYIQLYPQEYRHLQIFRKAKESDEKISNNKLQGAIYAVARLLVESSGVEMPLPLQDLKPYLEKKKAQEYSAHKVKSVRVLCTGINRDKELLFAEIEDDPGNTIPVKYNVVGVNEIFTPTLIKIGKLIPLPVYLHLKWITVDEDGFYNPEMIVVDPDHLIDVTAISHCFDHRSSNPVNYLIQKLTPTDSNEYLIRGKIVNHFLDLLIHNPDCDFEEIFSSCFYLDPLGMALLDDDTVERLYTSCKEHFNNVHQMVKEDLLQENIDREKVYLEPAFLSPEYGIQGRLDLLHEDDPASRLDIIELKSGKTFKPNIYGLNNPHYIQTLLYDLLIEYNSEFKLQKNYILYSSSAERRLRYAPVVRAKQQESLELRNVLVCIEYFLAKLPENPKSLGKLIEKHAEVLNGFAKRDAENIQKVLDSLTETELHYLIRHISFICREMKIAKCGLHGAGPGFSSFWQYSLNLKKEQYLILNHLRIIKNGAAKKDPMITFEPSERTSDMHRFRKGDIAILYGSDSAIPSFEKQLFKCSIINIENGLITVRLRSRQTHFDIFRKTEFWHLESDMLDGGFIQLQRSLISWAKSTPEKRKLFLGLAKPEAIKEIPRGYISTDLNPSQKKIFHKGLRSGEIFLLWGPPGTGKTSRMLRAWVEHFLRYTEKRILLLAYTNRAVDEICESVEKINHSDVKKHIRIGSRYGCDEKYEGLLLQNITSEISRREELIEVLYNTRIVTGTVASLQNKQDLFRLLNFDVLIADEASQILDPALAGIIPQIDQTILIGDHKQLPAVTVQQEIKEDPHLLPLGLKDPSVSLFERLLKQYQKNSWEKHFGMLHQQGRMHRDIMNVAGPLFYENKLNHFPGKINLTTPLELKVPDNLPKEYHCLASQRILFSDVPVSAFEGIAKVNIKEAEKIVQLITAILALYRYNDLKIKENTIGVITPFRAQIAKIKELLQKKGLGHLNITVDTVERYQGSERNIILMSLVISDPAELKMIQNLDEEKMDRKLNVALTRARDQFILVCNHKTAASSKDYKYLIQRSYKMK